MKSPRLHVARWFLIVWLELLTGKTASAGEPLPAMPLLTGAGAAQISAQTLSDVRTLVHGVPGQATARLWLCDCRYCLAMAHCNELGFIDAYLTPRLFTEQIIRGQRVDLCRFPGGSSGTSQESELSGGWFLDQNESHEYAMVAAAGQMFTPGGPLGHPILLRLKGQLSDEDIVNLARALQQTVPTQQMSELEPLGSDRVRMRGWVRRRGLDCFELVFHKVAGKWQPTTKKPHFLLD